MIQLGRSVVNITSEFYDVNSLIKSQYSQYPEKYTAV